MSWPQPGECSSLDRCASDAIIDVQGKGRRVYVTPAGEVRTVPVPQGENSLEPRRTLRLDEALAQALPGDDIILLPGIYYPKYNDSEERTSYVLKKAKGREEAPIRVRGCGSSTIIDGIMHPAKSGLPFLRIDRSSWVIVEDLTVRNCWPEFVRIDDSTYTTLRNINGEGSRRFIRARGSKTRHLLVEKCSWRQDTGAGWSDVAWGEVKCPEGFYTAFNGGFVACKDISGDVVIRNNFVEDCFNAIRMKMDKERKPTINQDVEIYDNTFMRVRDNVIEPEWYARNWYVHHNFIVDAHAPFSFDCVYGEDWFFFANRVALCKRPGHDLDKHNVGRVYKFQPTAVCEERGAPGKFAQGVSGAFFFHNSYYLRTPLANEAGITFFVHLNNAVVLCKEDQSQRCDCPTAPALIAGAFPIKCAWKEDADQCDWPSDVVFKADVTNIQWNSPPSYDWSGLTHIPSLEFANPQEDDFNFKAASPIGWEPHPLGLCGSAANGGVAAGDMPGAIQRDGSFYGGPAFALFDQCSAEQPRVTRAQMKVKADGVTIIVTVDFSLPIAEQDTSEVRLMSAEVCLKPAEVEFSARRFVAMFRLPSGAKGSTSEAQTKRFRLKLPRLHGVNEARLTGWAADESQLELCFCSPETEL